MKICTFQNDLLLVPLQLSQAVGEVNEPTVPLVHHQLSYIFQSCVKAQFVIALWIGELL